MSSNYLHCLGCGKESQLLHCLDCGEITCDECAHICSECSAYICDECRNLDKDSNPYCENCYQNLREGIK